LYFFFASIKKIIDLHIFCVVIFYGSKIFFKKFCKTRVFFSKKIEIFEIQNFNKIPSLTIFFYFFSIFGILFSISPIQTCPKIMEFFVVFFWKGKRFYQRFLENSKSSFKKNNDIWNFFFQNSAVYYFFYFWHFIFNFVYLYLLKKCKKFLCFLFCGLEVFSTNFGKSWNIFKKI